MRIWVSAHACVVFVMKRILLQNFVSTQTQALLGFSIQWVQVKGMLHYFGGGVKVGCGPIRQNKGKRMEPKITSCYMLYSTPVNFYVTENTWDKCHNRQGYFVVECMNVFGHS